MLNDYRILFNRSSILGHEMEYMQQAVRTGQVAGGGEFAARCEQLLQNTLSVPRALLTTSCTHALEMMAMLLDVQPGDDVIVPSFTFVSTVNAFVIRGAKPVFADIRPDTLNIDETHLPELITPRTKAIIVVHYAGVACEMDEILSIAKERGIPVLEDNAHGLFARYRGKHLGTLGLMAAQSFHATKNIMCGEGGALILNDPQYVDRAEILREKGTNRSKFFRGQIDKYTWVDIGSSYVMSDILAAFLYGQLEVWPDIQARREVVWQRYYDELGRWASELSVQVPTIPAECDQAYHMFYLILPDPIQRDELIGFLRNKGILSVFHYLPLHLSPMGRMFGGKEGSLPVTERVSTCLLRLPFYATLTDADQGYVIDTLKSWKPS